MNEQNAFGKAITCSTRKHPGVTRTGSDKPYILHPIQVAAIVSTMTDQQTAIVVGVLHDLVKDTDTSLDTIRAEFGAPVADLLAEENQVLLGVPETEAAEVQALPPVQGWERRKQASVERLVQEPCIEVKMIVLADKLSNVAAMKGDYAQVGDALWNRFHQTAPDRQAWYYRAVADATRSLSAHQAWQAYNRLVQDFFGKY